ncbi:hypothetical protein NS383_01850 [Pseudomonas oryzihabitans]|nr:hypothetical protein NS383_01850 [Pseudomonas psychrotolerans]
MIILVEISRQITEQDVDRNKTRWMLYIYSADGVLKRVGRERRSLGRFLVRREGLENSVDTLGRWILHHIAEVDLQRSEADEKDRAVLEERLSTLCDEFRRRDRY